MMAIIRPSDTAPVLRTGAEHHRCDLCWETFATVVELDQHVAIEDDRLYDLDGDD